MTNQTDKVVRLALVLVADLRELGYGENHAIQLPASFDALAKALDDLRDRDSEKSSDNEGAKKELSRSEQEAAAAEAFYKVAHKRPSAQPGPDSTAWK